MRMMVPRGLMTAGWCVLVSAALAWVGGEARAPLRRKISLLGTIFGFFLASYTGVLLSATAQPFWSEARLMGALFLASGASTGMAAISLLLFLILFHSFHLLAQTVGPWFLSLTGDSDSPFLSLPAVVVAEPVFVCAPKISSPGGCV